MRCSRSLVAGILLAAVASAALAQQQGHHHGHGGMSMPDARQPVDFPPQMQAQFLANMRDHVKTLDEILQALAARDPARASRVAADRLGLASPSAEGCEPAAGGQAAAPPPGSMAEMMAHHMPESMRAMGLALHRSASEFATVAAKAGPQDTTAVLGALSQVTQNCVACHSAYRLR
ncbi:MAG: hypothetical protein U1E23_05495 [Reyranellaceae bacterium]